MGAPAFRTSAKSTKWILIVEDEADIRDLLANMLDLQFGNKIKVVTAADGVEGTSRIQFQAYDCIVTDLKMPRKEGPAFLEATHQSALNSHTPVIIFSGFPDPDLLSRYPLCSFIQKPSTTEKVVQAVETQIKLGRTDRRVGAHVLNSLMLSAQNFFQKAIENPGQIGSPRAKRKDEAFSSNLTRFVSIKMGDGAADFAFSFEEALIKGLAKAATGKEDFDMEKLISGATQTLVHGAKINAVSIPKAVTLPGNHKDLTKKRGIVIPILTPIGQLEILAMSDA